MICMKRIWQLWAMVLLVCFGPGLGSSAAGAAENNLVVFAAASTTNALNDIGTLYEARGMGQVTFSFASSSTLAKQIASGAPADVFVSADLDWMNYLEEKKRVAPENRLDLLGNQLVLIVPADSAIKSIDLKPGASLADALGKEGRLALGDPEHTPAGKYGRQALTHLGLWDQVKDRLAPMKDVRAALVMVERAEAPVGVVYATDAAISQKVRVVGSFPADSHPPIVYPVATLSGAKVEAAKRFVTLLKSPEARAIFTKFGFTVR
ncbi:MAG: molybdate ABC transporter substrate-binding protein [Desulfobacteraceae bacterium]|nr:molybdate ABC transporter substrate-binding protein [Desulfobacteraceae bacterium]